MISAESVRKVLDYCPATGVFRWRVSVPSAGGRTRVGQEAGFVRGDGYRFIGINGGAYPAQKLAWLHMTGTWPKKIVDHVNRNRSDNCWANLRLASRVENNRNKGLRSDNRSGVTGVSFDQGRAKWTARIKVGGSYRFLGRYAEKAEAVSARLAAEYMLFGDFAPQAA